MEGREEGIGKQRGKNEGREREGGGGICIRPATEMYMYAAHHHQYLHNEGTKVHNPWR